MLAWSDVHSAVKPLRFIFWGGLLWIFDLNFSTTTNGYGFKFDLLDDTLGTILIAIGLFRLARIPVQGKYPPVMRYLKAVIVASIISTVILHWIFPHPEWFNVLLSILNLCQLVGTVLFCLAMKWFAEEAGMPAIARSWRTTLLLFLFIYALPLGILYIAGWIAMATGSSFHIDLGAGVLIVLAIFAVPLIHLFVSTSRMRRAAEHGIQTLPPAGGFPVIMRDKPMF